MSFPWFQNRLHRFDKLLASERTHKKYLLEGRHFHKVHCYSTRIPVLCESPRRGDLYEKRGDF